MQPFHRMEMHVTSGPEKKNTEIVNLPKVELLTILFTKTFTYLCSQLSPANEELIYQYNLTRKFIVIMKNLSNYYRITGIYTQQEQNEQGAQGLVPSILSPLKKP